MDKGFFVETDSSKIDRLMSENRALRESRSVAARRDQFAMAALTGLLAKGYEGDTAQNAVALADATIAALDGDG